MQSRQIQKLDNYCMKRKNLSVADKLSHSFTQENLQLNQLKQKQLPPQLLFATLTQNSQIEPLQFLDNHETVLPSQKNDCPSILAGFGTDQFSIRINVTRKKVIIKPLVPFSFDAVKPKAI